jgi:hypothetical protein
LCPTQSAKGRGDRPSTAAASGLTRCSSVVTPSYPVQVRYTLTESGRELIQVLRPLVGWSHRWGSPSSDATPG